jgi:hypothetical protein
MNFLKLELNKYLFLLAKETWLPRTFYSKNNNENNKSFDYDQRNKNIYH